MLNKINILLFLATLLGVILLTPATKHFTEAAGETPSPLKVIKKRVYRQQYNVASRGNGVNLNGFKVVKKIENVKMSHYDLCSKCVGNNSKGYGKSGRKIESYRSIAVDPNFIPLDTFVFIPEINRIVRADDTGSKVKEKRIDLFTGLSHEENLQLGVKTVNIYILEKG